MLDTLNIMQIYKLIEILNILSPYTDPTDYIETEHDQLYISYTGILSEPVYNYVTEESSGYNLGENYEDYTTNREDYDDYLMFYT